MCSSSRFSFQSLKGILVNFNQPTIEEASSSVSPVSIPQRDFGEFQPEPIARIWLAKVVSIPQRDFGEFQQFHSLLYEQS
ncbi:Epoxyqueuosine (oQ) reductase QueG [Geitlerinema sp. FC II]|nr:Epoxyqueuosine (oQ) reductase QueG [Geitlerinema sp. FC II]